MEINRTKWEENDYKPTPYFNIGTECSQPCIKICIGWNQPKKPYKPFFIIQIFIVKIRFGWYY